MSISSETRKAGPFTGNDVTTIFPFTFKVFQASDVLVVKQLISTGAETTLVLNTDYTVTLNSDQNTSPGGDVVLLSPLPSTYTLSLTSAVQNLQLTNLTNQGGFYPKVINDALDRLTILVQQVKLLASRSLMYPLSDDSSVSTELASVDQRADKILAFDSNGEPYFPYTVGDISNAQASADAAEASAIAAAASEAAALASEGLAQEWASKFDGTVVDSTDFSSKEYAIGVPTSGSSKDWATKTSSAVDGSDYSAKEWAKGTQTRGLASGGSSKDWANYTGGTVDNAEYSAKKYATDAAASALAAQTVVSSILWNDVVFVSSNTVIDDTYNGKLVAVDSSGGSVQITLPLISSLDLSGPFALGVKKTDGSSNAVTIVGSGSDTIDGGVSKTIVSAESGMTMIPDTDPNPDEWTSIEFGATGGNMTVDRFSGTGAQTAFTLSVDPGSENNTNVYISGVYQQKDTYSVSGTTLTFVTAPPLGADNIEVICGTALSVGVPSDNTVTSAKIVDSNIITSKIADDNVTNAKLANMATQTIKGRTTAGTGDPEDLTAAQATAILNAFTGDSGSGGVKGLVPAPASGDAAAGKFLKADGTFSVPPGLGDTNFITNGQANVDTTGWATYADAAGTSPVDGTGGSPTVTFTRTTSSPLIGAASFLITKDAANRQGEGASYDFTIDTAYQARVLQIEFDYILSSGTFTAGSTSADSDVTVWIYDVTNAVVIQPTTYKLFSNSSTISSKFVSNFQTAANSTSYRLILHVGSTSASAYTLKVDRVKVSPSQYVYGTPITDWVSWTPVPATSSGSITNYNSVGFKRRVGDSEEILARINFTGANTFNDFQISTPSSINYDKLPTFNFSAGTAYVRDGSTGYFANVRALASPANRLDVQVQSFATHTGTVYPSLGVTTNSAPGTLDSGDYIFISAQYPVQGWSSSVQTSDQADSRVVAMRATTSSTSIAYNSSTTVVFSTVSFDTHSAYNASTGIYTVPVSGVYQVIGGVVWNNLTTSTTNSYIVSVLRNGSGVATGSYAPRLGSDSAPTLTALVQCNAGDTLNINAYQADSSPNARALNGASSGNYFSVQRLSQASLISATETVAANCYNSTSQSIANSGFTRINYDTKVIDTHNAVTTGASWVFTAPISGTYRLSASAFFASAAYAAAPTAVQLRAIQAGSVSRTVYLDSKPIEAALTIEKVVQGSILLKMSAGDTVYVDVLNNRTAGATTLTGTTNATNISIERIGI